MIRQLNDPRELRGLAILSQPDTIIQTDKNAWRVKSQSKDDYYQVMRSFPKDRKERMRSPGTWTCTCPDHTTRNVICKHIHAVQFSLKLKGEIEENSTTVQIEEAEPKVTCAFCKSENVVKWGHRKTGFGQVQRYACRECNRKFVVDKGFCNMKNSLKTITLTLDLYFKGLSQRKIADHLKQFENVCVNQTTILRWIQKYMKLLQNIRKNTKQRSGISGIATK